MAVPLERSAIIATRDFLSAVFVEFMNRRGYALLMHKYVAASRHANESEISVSVQLIVRIAKDHRDRTNLELEKAICLPFTMKGGLSMS